MLYNNYITSLSANSFANLGNLEELYARRTDLMIATFVETNMHRKLSDNLLSSIGPDDLAGLTALKDLYVLVFLLLFYRMSISFPDHIKNCDFRLNR
jgi:hypothetical protein